MDRKISPENRRMSFEEFNAALLKMGYSQAFFAKMFELKSELAVANWASGRVKRIPGPIAVITQYLLERPEARAWFESRCREPVPMRRRMPRGRQRLSE